MASRGCHRVQRTDRAQPYGNGGGDKKLIEVLQWALTYGDAYREALRAGRGWAGPEQPEIMPGYDGWYNDFWELSTDRQFGMAVGPIPRSSIIDHTREWPDDEADSFRFIMRRMDDVFRNFKPPKISQATVDNGLSPQERLTRIFGSRIN